MGVDDGLAPLVHGGKCDAGSTGFGVDAPGEVALTVPLELAGATKKLLAWSSLIGLIGESKAPHVLVSIIIPPYH